MSPPVYIQSVEVVYLWRVYLRYKRVEKQLIYSAIEIRCKPDNKILEIDWYLQSIR